LALINTNEEYVGGGFPICFLQRAILFGRARLPAGVWEYILMARIFAMKVFSVLMLVFFAADADQGTSMQKFRPERKIGQQWTVETTSQQTQGQAAPFRWHPAQQRQIKGLLTGQREPTADQIGHATRKNQSGRSPRT